MKRFFGLCAGFYIFISTASFAVVTPMNVDSGLTAEQLLSRDLEAITSILKSADSHKLDQIRSIEDFDLTARTMIEREFGEKQSKLKTIKFFNQSIGELEGQVKGDEARIRSIRLSGSYEEKNEIDVLKESISNKRQKIEEARGLLKNFEKSVLEDYYRLPE